LPYSGRGLPEPEEERGRGKGDRKKSFRNSVLSRKSRLLTSRFLEEKRGKKKTEKNSQVTDTQKRQGEGNFPSWKKLTRNSKGDVKRNAPLGSQKNIQQQPPPWGMVHKGKEKNPRDRSKKVREVEKERSESPKKKKKKKKKNKTKGNARC